MNSSLGHLDVGRLSEWFRRFCGRVELVIWIIAGCGCGLDVNAATRDL